MKPKLPSGLVALSTAAVLTVYSAGFLKTRAAAAKIAQTDDRPRPPVPQPVVAPTPPVVVSQAPPPAAASPTVQVPRRTPSAKHTKVQQTEPLKAQAEITAGEAVATPSAPATTGASAGQAAPVTSPALAPAVPPAPPTPPPSPPSQYKDGSYTGWGTSRHGDIEATVVIANGKIASAYIS